MTKRFVLLAALATLYTAPVFADADSGANGEMGAAPTATTMGAWGGGSDSNGGVR